MINYGKQTISKRDVSAVVDVLKSNFLTQGPVVPKFERTVSAYCGAKHAVAVNSATSALHIACLALNVSNGDYIWTSAISFAASANCARYCGANVDFVDIDKQTYNLCPKKLAEKLRLAKLHNLPLPKVVIVVHMCGQPCEMKHISLLSKKYGFKVIEDASHAIGSVYDDAYTGSSQYSDITVFSFHPVKIITTGEGGVALTNSKELAEKMCLYRSHGVTKDASKTINNSHGDWYYEQSVLGYNYRLTDIQAALGISQMKELDSFIKNRNEKAKYYDDLLKEDYIEKPFIADNCMSSFHLYVIKVKNAYFIKNKKEIFADLRAAGIGVHVHYIPIYLHPYYENLGFKKGHCPEAENYYAQALTLPIYPSLSAQQQEYIMDCLKTVLKNYKVNEVNYHECNYKS